MFNFENLIIGCNENSLKHLLSTSSTMIFKNINYPKKNQSEFVQNLIKATMNGKIYFPNHINHIQFINSNQLIITVLQKNHDIEFDQLKIYEIEDIEGLNWKNDSYVYRIYDWFSTNRSPKTNKYKTIQSIEVINEKEILAISEVKSLKEVSDYNPANVKYELLGKNNKNVELYPKDRQIEKKLKESYYHIENIEMCV